MAGKLLGQLGVGLLIVSVYVGLAILALAQAAGPARPLLVVYFFVFFLLSYVLFGALMSALGAAVSEASEAQSLMGLVMLLLMAPYGLMQMISRTPNSAFSAVMSFMPPINTFATWRA